MNRRVFVGAVCGMGGRRGGTAGGGPPGRTQDPSQADAPE